MKAPFYITIRRIALSHDTIIGVLQFKNTNGFNVFDEYVTIELPWKHNIKNKSCIADGTYTLFYRKDRKRWQFEHVKDRSAIQIHGGVKTEQSKGCILIPNIKDFNQTLITWQDYKIDISIRTEVTSH